MREGRVSGGGGCENPPSRSKGREGLWWVVVGVKPVPSCVLSEGGVVVTWKGCGGCESLTLRGREGWWW